MMPTTETASTTTAPPPHELVRTPGRPTVTAVIPALNEARNLPYVLGQLSDVVSEVILVDGHSTDGTVEVARRVRPDARVIRQSRRGKGNALACGFDASRGDIVVMLDADGSTSGEEIPAYVDALLAGAHFAKGTRFAFGGGSDDITRLRGHGNALLNTLANRRYGTAFTDLCYGYNAFWRECLAPLQIGEPGIEVHPGDPAPPPPAATTPRWGDGFEIETLLSVRLSMLGMQVTEVGSFESTRLHGRSNLHAVRDGIRVLRTIAVERQRFAPYVASAPPLGRPWERFRTASDERPAPRPTTIDLRDGAPAAVRSALAERGPAPQPVLGQVR